jgi:hypothetical protein
MLNIHVCIVAITQHCQRKARNVAARVHTGYARLHVLVNGNKAGVGQLDGSRA